MPYTADTRVLCVNPDHPEADLIDQAAAVIRSGGLVAFPTETVYGLGANATDTDAVDRIFSAKERPAVDPLIVHLASVDQLSSVALDVPEIGRELTALWPGPLTMILKRHPSIPANVSAGLDTVGVRVPSHPVAQALIKAAGVPIAAPSANRFSRPSATTAAHVLEDLQGRVDMVLDGGATTFGIESTIVDVTSDPPRILRYGAIKPETFELLGFSTADHLNTGAEDTAKPAPGMMLKHYSPHARLLFYGDGSSLDAILGQMQIDARIFASEGFRVGILAPDAETALFNRLDAVVVSLGSNVDQIAARLFAAMRELDHEQVDVILARGYERTGIGAALWERLLRAAEGEIVQVREKTMTSGKLILINGASSSGKTSVASALRKCLAESFFIASVDTFVHNMLDWERHFISDPPVSAPQSDWFSIRTIDDAGHRAVLVSAGEQARRFLFGMHAAVAAFVSVGNNLIFDDVLYDPAFLENYLRLFDASQVLFVGLRCPLEVLEQREHARGDRSIGHARGHYELVHQHEIYDLEVDTSVLSPEAAAEQIARRFYAGAPDAFHRLQQQVR